MPGCHFVGRILLLWNLTYGFQTYVMVFHHSWMQGHGDASTGHACRPLGKAEQCVANWSLVTLSHKGTTLACFIVMGTTYPLEVTWGEILTTSWLCLGKGYHDRCVTGAYVLQWDSRTVGKMINSFPVKSFLFSGRLFKEMLQEMKRKGVAYCVFSTNTPSTLWTSLVIQLIFNYIHKTCVCKDQ